eukprot:TRINITY_DN7895_c0_g1_i2.p1 TRINITY_DN7895_c0_g1~~TRINITY_DN7895_c0_g1_i2.p1  ORF type:complete len:118 (-),score=33.08 TRINITY_DN7895_c0_g1_i2:14-367(-)
MAVAYPNLINRTADLLGISAVIFRGIVLPDEISSITPDTLDPETDFHLWGLTMRMTFELLEASKLPIEMPHELEMSSIMYGNFRLLMQNRRISMPIMGGVMGLFGMMLYYLNTRSSL